MRNDELLSTRSLDGANKATAFNDEGVNRLPVVDGDPSEDGLNQYSNLDAAARTYTETGSLRDDATLEYVFDIDDRLTEVRDAVTGAALRQFSYSADGRRVVTDSTAGRRRQLFSGWQVVEERNGSDIADRQFVTGRGMDDHVQMRDLPTNQSFYYHASPLGTVGALTNNVGEAREVYEYSWLGRPTAYDLSVPAQVTVHDFSPSGNPYLFQGRRWEQSLGAYDFRHRWYSPSTGEFLSIDPSGLWRHGTGNGYGAFSGDPWNRRDPLGLRDRLIFGAIYMARDGVWRNDRGPGGPPDQYWRSSGGACAPLVLEARDDRSSEQILADVISNYSEDKYIRGINVIADLEADQRSAALEPSEVGVSLRDTAATLLDLEGEFGRAFGERWTRDWSPGLDADLQELGPAVTDHYVYLEQMPAELRSSMEGVGTVGAHGAQFLPVGMVAGIRNLDEAAEATWRGGGRRADGPPGGGGGGGGDPTRRLGDLEPIHRPGMNPDVEDHLRGLSDAELLETATAPLDGQMVKVRPGSNSLRDGNTRVIEMQRRLDPDTRIPVDEDW